MFTEEYLGVRVSETEVVIRWGEFFDGLNTDDQNALESMGMADWFRSNVQWCEPWGIGACHSLAEFDDLQQAPWLVAFS